MAELKRYQESKEFMIGHFKQLGDFRHDFRIWNLTSLIASKINEGYVLDIGCGTGLLLKMLHDKGVGSLGIEPNKTIMRLAKKNNPNLKIISCYAEDIGKLKRKFDAITLLDVLEHIEDDKGQIKRMHSQINKNGKLIIVVPAFQLLYGKRDKDLGHYRRYSKKDLVSKLKKAGFEIDSIRYWNFLGFFPYLFYEKILKKQFNSELRAKNDENVFKDSIRKLIDFWFRHVENNVSFGFGLSLICIAKKV